MALKKLTDRSGVSVYVAPDDVGAIRTGGVEGCCVVDLRGGEMRMIVARGTPDEVHDAIFGPTGAQSGASGISEPLISKAEAREALTLEYRMALGWPGMSAEDAHRFLSVRVALRNLAQRLELVLDETLINTPLSGMEPK